MVDINHMRRVRSFMVHSSGLCTMKDLTPLSHRHRHHFRDRGVRCVARQESPAQGTRGAGSPGGEITPGQNDRPPQHPLRQVRPQNLGPGQGTPYLDLRTLPPSGQVRTHVQRRRPRPASLLPQLPRTEKTKVTPHLFVGASSAANPLQLTAFV